MRALRTDKIRHTLYEYVNVLSNEHLLASLTYQYSEKNLLTVPGIPLIAGDLRQILILPFANFMLAYMFNVKK